MSLYILLLLLPYFPYTPAQPQVSDGSEYSDNVMPHEPDRILTPFHLEENPYHQQSPNLNLCFITICIHLTYALLHHYKK